MKRILILFAVVLVLGAAAHKGHRQKYWPCQHSFIFAERGAAAHKGHRQKYAADAEDTPATRLLMQQHKQALADKLAAEGAVSRAEQLKYQGMRMAPDVNAAGSERRFQDKIAAEFERTDQVPGERLKYFDWCLSNPTLIHVGWYGSIQRAAGDEVEVRIAPRFMGTRTLTATVLDYCIETWKYSGGSLIYVKSMPGEGPGVILGN